MIGEGAAVLVLEELEHARARGATIRAPRCSATRRTCDAAHVASPTENGEGAQRCMRLALADAGLSPADVDYLNAHATSTPAGDPAEARAIRAVFGPHVDRVAVSATKSMTGHMLGAAGALEALLCVRALETGHPAADDQSRPPGSRVRARPRRQQGAARARADRALELVRLRRQQRDARARSRGRRTEQAGGDVGQPIILASDHRGFALKQALRERLERAGHATLDFGTTSEAPVDYPEFAAPAARAVAEGRSERAIVICGSGLGVSYTANRFPGVRAALVQDVAAARGRAAPQRRERARPVRAIASTSSTPGRS